jgi:light-regulated signal transduction histidine kinase (bacteriophytochrome)
VGDLCSVLLLTADGSSLRLATTYDLDPNVAELAREAFGTKPMAVVPTQQRVLQTGDALVVPRVTTDQLRSSTTEDRATFSLRIGMHSILVVPLRARGRSIGILNIVRHRPDRPPYDERDRDFAQSLADHAALAILNARVLRRQYDELKVAKEVAESAHRDLESFSYSIAHDLRAPLRGIKGHSVALMEDLGSALDVEARRRLERIDACAGHMGGLIDALLGLARINRREISREAVDLTHVARGVVSDLRERDPTRAIDVAIAPGLVVRADRAFVEAVVVNLVGNAWKFTARRPDARIEVGRTSKGGHSIYFVRDNGAGFDQTQAPTLFAPFRRLHAESDFPGIGVGLATVERIVRRHGGRAWAEGVVGAGATFYFTLEAGG